MFLQLEKNYAACNNIIAKSRGVMEPVALQLVKSYCVPLSQCSTLVRNTVVRATFKVNGKPPILGSRSPLTP